MSDENATEAGEAAFSSKRIYPSFELRQRAASSSRLPRNSSQSSTAMALVNSEAARAPFFFAGETFALLDVGSLQ